jgi:hypothetical protein
MEASETTSVEFVLGGIQIGDLQLDMLDARDARVGMSNSLNLNSELKQKLDIGRSLT